METIRVNMTPCEDIKTIHASQNDNEAREWGFELHNNGEKIDSSSISDQMVFKAYEGGTEEILPTNGSTPTTSPFKGDIRYPQGLLSDQEFLYRESPTEEDGLAKLTRIKGNTLAWNQLVQNGNFADSTRWTSVASATINSISNNTINVTTASTAQSGISNTNITMIQGHKYLLMGTVKTTGQTYISISGAGSVLFNTNSFTTKSNIFTWTSASGNWTCMIRNWDANSATFEAKNIMLFDLTQMGLDISSPSDFTSLFPLSYYSYNQGTLLSFNGNGIKTVGKNLLNFIRPSTTVSGLTFTNNNGVITINGTATANAFYTINGINLPKDSYYIGSFNDEVSNNVHVAGQAQDNSYPFDMVVSSKNRIIRINADIKDFIIWVNSGTTLNNFVVRPMVSLVSAETFEPYTSSTLSLPISTYFPSGMKSAGDVYDELTETKAITRIGSVDLGTLAWSKESPGFYSQPISNMKPTSDVSIQKILCSKYQWSGANKNSMPNKSIRENYQGSTALFIVDNDYSTGTDLKNSLSGVYLYYELATESETSFTTASLVIENAEIPLSNEDGALIGKCTEQLSAEPGFHDAKIKLADEDGECYSNKIQLHVEREPS